MERGKSAGALIKPHRFARRTVCVDPVLLNKELLGTKDQVVGSAICSILGRAKIEGAEVCTVPASLLYHDIGQRACQSL